MARAHSKKRRLLGFAKLSDLASKKKKQSPGRVQTRTGDRLSTPEISSTTSPGMLARMRSFHRSSQSPSTNIKTGLADAGTGRRAQEKEEESTEAIPAQDAAATSTGSEEQEQSKVVPTKNWFCWAG
ncbi:hypothetical protein F5J12DRAFT_784227 [Pisolithus orientalis]|uniref:uncharacterized protein n=1 Tax=Pisolithus orientalis TaxID=936130 RepID=UPI002224A8D6|nr:uncharacterized protein F5J12DRAFT_784227 [Pisolithus orientalis]KAI6000983.1 hypothetical protein F5J12DRAFT_784227 [Pisolithus orientalis]